MSLASAAGSDVGRVRLIANLPIAFEYFPPKYCFQWNHYSISQFQRVCGSRCSHTGGVSLYRRVQRPLARRLPAAEPHQFQAEFSVTSVFRVRIVASLVAATALKVARNTPPCESERGRQSPVVLESAESVTQGQLTQRSVMTGSIFEPSRCRIVRVAHFQIHPACYGDLSNNHC